MAEDLKSGIGATFSIVSGAPATYNQAGFEALTFVEVGEVISIGEFGGSAEVITHTPIKTGIIKKFKGSKDYGSQSIQYGKLTDLGQTALSDGFDGANEFEEHSIEVAYSDNTKRYYTGVVTSYTNQELSTSAVVNGASTIEVTNKIVEVVPA